VDGVPGLPEDFAAQKVVPERHMTDSRPRCPKCQKPMDRGHVPDLAHGQILQSNWAPGEPERRRFFGGIKYNARELIPLSAYRCPSCGYVEFYAVPD
jgi:DNA-directed RNA polymerase subunit RPC12/RpoP